MATHVLGVEFVDEVVLHRLEFLEDQGGVVKSTAENIPLKDNSQAFVSMENVLEHVGSVRLSLEEAYKILKPGCVLFIRTTNRS